MAGGSVPRLDTRPRGPPRTGARPGPARCLGPAGDSGAHRRGPSPGLQVTSLPRKQLEPRGGRDGGSPRSPPGRAAPPAPPPPTAPCSAAETEPGRGPPALASLCPREGGRGGRRRSVYPPPGVPMTTRCREIAAAVPGSWRPPRCRRCSAGCGPEGQVAPRGEGAAPPRRIAPARPAPGWCSPSSPCGRAGLAQQDLPHLEFPAALCCVRAPPALSRPLGVPSPLSEPNPGSVLSPGARGHVTDVSGIIIDFL